MPAASSTSLTLSGGTGQLRATPSRTISERESQSVADDLRLFSQYQVWRNTTAQRCEEIAQLILPTSRNTFFYQNFNWPGAKKTQQQVDATGAINLHQFCAIANSLVTPRNMLWHGMAADEYVMKDRATRLWFESTTKMLFRERYEASAGFDAQNYNNWQSLGAFGNATMFIDKFDARWGRRTKGFRYKAVPFGETFFGENHQGKVDRIIRWFKLTAYQAVQKWGRANLPQNLVGPLEQDSQWPYNFLHVVMPREEDYDPEALDERSLPYVSRYISIEGRCWMQKPSGYRSFPYAVSRYDQTPGEVYGRGPADIVLPSLKTLNAEKATFLKQGHRAADPVLLLADDGLMGMSLRPGALNPGGWSADGKPLVGVLPTGDIQISKEMMADEKDIIGNVFLTSIYKTLVENPNMTATQVIQIVNERAMLVTPTLGRQHTEYTPMMVEREMELAAEMGMLDPMPARLREAMGDYQVTDTSPLAMAARSGEFAGFVRVIESVRELVNVTQDPSLLDRFDFDTAIPEGARSQTVPERWMADDKMVAQKRKARSDAQQRQEQIAAMPAQAAVIKARAVAMKSGALERQPQGAM